MKRRLKELQWEGEDVKVARYDNQAPLSLTDSEQLKMLTYSEDTTQSSSVHISSLPSNSSHTELVTIKNPNNTKAPANSSQGTAPPSSSTQLTRFQNVTVPTPTWHAPWELSAVISGHLGWVRSIAFDPNNEWFVTGSADRTIKVIKACYSA